MCTTPSDAWWSVEVTWDDCSRLLLGFQILNYGSFSHHWSLKDHHCCACNKKELSENSGRKIRLTLFTPWRSWPSLSQALCCIWWLVLGNPERQIWRWYLFRNLLNTSKDLASISWWNGQPVRQKWAKASHPSYPTPQGFLCGKKTKSPNFPGKSHRASNQASSWNHIVVCTLKYYKVALYDPRQRPFQTRGPKSWQF